MSYALNNLATTDSYTTANTLRAVNSSRLNLDVTTAAIMFQLGTGTLSPVWDTAEIMQIPSFKSRDRRFDWIRVRSFTPGAPGRVSIEAVTANEIA